MENVSIVTKLLNFLSDPKNFSVLVSVFLISVFVYCLNFLPEEILIKLKIEGFLDNSSFIIFLVGVSTLFLIFVRTVYYVTGIINRKFKIRKFKKNQKEIFDDEDCKKILMEMIEEHPESVEYPVDHYCIKLLTQYNLIILASSSGYLGYNGKQIFPYILQTETVKKLKKELAE